MSKCIILNLGTGSLREGFPLVTAQLYNTQTSSILQKKEIIPLQQKGSLPPAPELVDAYRNWEVLYKAFSKRLNNRGNIEVVFGSPTNISEANLEQLREILQTHLDNWLNTESFRPIERYLTRKLQEEDAIRVIITTEDEEIRHLPWHLWHFFEDYPKAEIALSAPKFDLKPHSQTPVGKVRILAVFGDSQGIDLDNDMKLLKGLPRNAELVTLAESGEQKLTRKSLTEFLWDAKGWDILFFAGHSKTEGEKGRIFLNETESLTIDELKHALKTAIARGLQLAIFNSCQGLGLARQLEDLHIPQVIVMKQSVPDQVAHQFLQHFLEQFASGESFYLSVRQAREKLQGIENEFPCASWLPVICQNPATIPPNWQKLCYEGRYQPLMPLIVSILVTSLVLGIRSLGMLQGLELQAYDQLMRSRPDEGTDPHLLLVTATQQDIEDNGGYPLSDQTLAQAIEKLNQYQPRLIGLDILRDRPREPGNQELMSLFRQQENLIAICSHPQAGNAEKAGFKPPPGVTEDFLGFSDVFVDKSDQVIRRHLLSDDPYVPDTPDQEILCPTDHSLSARIAFLYLAQAQQGLVPKIISNDVIQVGETTLNRLPNYLGVYQQMDNGGFQILLNYRTAKKPFATVTLGDVLAGKVKPELVKDKAIIIGVTDRTVSSDYHDTPLGEQPGVMIQAHMTSQIISAVSDKRPLLGVWHLWQEALWILAWAAIAGSLAWYFRRLWIAALVTVATLGILSGVCLFLLVQGWWIPLIPSGLGLVATSALILIYRSFLLQSPIRY